ncbi:MAG TPA: potassium channel family protein [Candidatus Dormibacteraeota bacterium]|nr:potassium channel family protein [Candidatus Dormibacteraeota bacterium]
MADRLALSEGSRYGIVLVLLACAVGTAIVSPPGALSSLITAILQGVSVLVAINPRSGARPRLALLAIVLLSVGGTALVGGGGSLARGIADLLNAAAIVVLPVIVVARFRRNLYVSVQAVLGAVCIYLVMGMLFASIDSAISHLTGQAFFAGSPQVSSSEYMYFSFITLTTVGYGDLTPGTGAARALAVVEALVGQLYLVTVIALIVGNFGRAREPRRGAGPR